MLRETKYDLLVSNAIQLLAIVAERPAYKQLFEDASALQSICERVVIPNMHLRDSDVEMFEDVRFTVFLLVVLAEVSNFGNQISLNCRIPKSSYDETWNTAMWTLADAQLATWCVPCVVYSKVR